MAQFDVPPYRLPWFRTSPPISVIVDKPPNQKTFYVHSSLLTHSSQYFCTVLNSMFKEGETKICYLEEDDASAFDLYVQYLYTNKYDVTLTVPHGDGGTEPMYYRMHAAAYALGNKLVAPKFKKLVLFNFASVLEPGRAIDMKLVLDMAITIYEGTSTHDGHEMRLILAKYCASRFKKLDKDASGVTEAWSEGDITAFVDAQLIEFIADVLGEVQGTEFSVTAILRHLGPSYDCYPMSCRKLMR